MASVSLTPLEQRLLDTVRIRGEMHGRQLAGELEADSGAVARCLVRLEGLGLLQSETLGRTKRYQVRSEGESALQTALERIERFDDPPPVTVLPVSSGGEARLVVVLPGIWIPHRAWLGVRRLVRGLEQPVEVLVYSERAAQRLARLPGNPVRDALKLHPERGLQLMGTRR